MSQVKKHQFEPVSLLTAEHGIIELAVICAQNQPDWLVPSSMILETVEYKERIWTYLWQNQEVSVYRLLPDDAQFDTLVILEGNTDVHRLGLHTKGKIRHFNVRISDVKDIDLSAQIKQTMQAHIPKLNESGADFDYLYQAVSVFNQVYLVPDLDAIAHRLVDLDG